VLDEHPTLENRNVCRVTVDVDVHLEPTDGPALALAATAALERLLVELDGRLAGDQALDGGRLIAALTAATGRPAALTIALLARLLAGLLAGLLAAASGATAATATTTAPTVA